MKELDYYSSEIVSEIISTAKQKFTFKSNISDKEILAYILMRYIIENDYFSKIQSFNHDETKLFQFCLYENTITLYDYAWNLIFNYKQKHTAYFNDISIELDKNSFHLKLLLSNEFEILHNINILNVKNTKVTISYYIDEFKKNIDYIINSDKRLKKFQKFEKRAYIIYRQLEYLNELFLNKDALIPNETLESVYAKTFGIAYRKKNIAEVKEIDVEKFLVANIELIDKNLTVVSEQFKVENGIIDVLCKDKNDNYVIIELKTKVSKSIIWQSLYYPQEIRRIKNVKNKAIKFIAFCPYYPRYIYDVLKETQQLENIEMFEYQIVVDDKDNIVDLIVENFENNSDKNIDIV